MKIQTKRLIFDTTVWTTSLLLALGVLAHDAAADSKAFPANHEEWKAECGVCHVAYPPQLLPVSSWRAIMTGLDKHFGTDASLDARSVAEIGTFLDTHAGRGRRAMAEKPVLRITETRWFLREHDEVPAAAWRHLKVKSAANCAACHAGAETGDYAERNLRLPRGIRMMED
jgi:hypothetical protein